MASNYVDLVGKVSLEEYAKIEASLKDAVISGMLGTHMKLRKPLTHVYFSQTPNGDALLTFDRDNGEWTYQISGNVEASARTEDRIKQILRDA